MIVFSDYVWMVGNLIKVPHGLVWPLLFVTLIATILGRLIYKVVIVRLGIVLLSASFLMCLGIFLTSLNQKEATMQLSMLVFIAVPLFAIGAALYKKLLRGVLSE